MIVLALLALIITPVFAFATLGFRETANTRTRNTAASSLGLAQTYFGRDVARSTFAALTHPSVNESCAPAAGHTIRLVTVEKEDDPTLGLTARTRSVVAAYSVGPMRENGVDVAGSSSLWRRECIRFDDDGDAGAGESVQVGSTEETQLVADITPASVTGTCSGANCLAATLSFTPIDPDVATTLRGRRQVSQDSSSLASISSPTAPTVALAVTPDDPPRFPYVTSPYVATFTATPTLAPGRTAASWSWSITSDATGAVASGFVASTTNAQTHNFDPATHTGRFTVRVTVTDDLGESGTTYRVIAPTNQPPVVRLNSTMGNIETVRCRPTNFSILFSSNPNNMNASFDPDGALNGGPSVPAGEPSWSFSNAASVSGDNWSRNAQFDTLGAQTASVTVRDVLGLTSSYTQRVYVQRGTVNFSRTDNANDGQNTASTSAFMRTVGSSTDRVREIFFRPKDWACGGKVVNITMYRCTSGVVPGVADGARPCSSSARQETLYRCAENNPAPATNPRWTYDVDKVDPCTRFGVSTYDPRGLWYMAEGNDPDNTEINLATYSANELPNNWRHVARFWESASNTTEFNSTYSGDWFVEVCTDLLADPAAPVTPDDPPGQRCFASRSFQRTVAAP